MRSHPGVAAKVFEVLGARADQHRDDLHLADQDLLRHRRRPRPRRGQGACTRPSSSAPTRSARGPDRRPPAHGHRLSGPHDDRLQSRSARAPPALVGTTILGLLAEREFPASEVVPFASERSAGKEIEWNGEALDLPGAERRVDPGPRPRPLLGRRRGQRRVGAAAGRGRRRRRRQHQLLAHARRRAAGRRRGQPRGGSTGHRGIVANPNCSTMQMVVALKPLHDEAGIERLVISTYQAVSGTGKAAIDELLAQSRAVLDGEEPRRRGLPAPDRLQRAGAGGQLPRRRRPHRRGAQADRRDPQDPRRPGDPGQRDLRPGPGRDRPLRGGQRRDARAARRPSARASCSPRRRG